MTTPKATPATPPKVPPEPTPEGTPATPSRAPARLAPGSWAVFALALAGAGVALWQLGGARPLAEWFVVRMAPVWGWTLVFVAATCVAGLWLLERVLRVEGLPPLEAVVTGAGVGVVAFVLASYTAGFLHLFGPVFAVGAPTVMLAAGGRHAVSRWQAWKRERRHTRDPRTDTESTQGLGREAGQRAPRWRTRGALSRLIAIAGGVGLLFVYLGALTPDAINFDASCFHLALAADYARLGGIVPFRADHMRSVPHLASLVSTWAFQVPGLPDEALRWMLALHLELAFFAGTLAGISAMTRWLLGTEDRPCAVRGAWTAMFLFPAIFVYDSNIGGAADHVLAFFAAPLFLAATRAAETLDARRFALAGLLAGGAFLVKYQAVQLLAGITLVFVIQVAGAFFPPETPREPGTPESARGPRRALRGPAIRRLATGMLWGAALFSGVVAPHFGMGWVFHHNPVYPFASDLFPLSAPMVKDGALLVEHLMKAEEARPRGSLFERLLSSLRLVFTYSFEPHYSFTGGFPSSGSLFTLGLPMVPFLKERRRIGLAAAAGCAALFVWALTLRVDRNLQTFTPLLVATTAAVLARAWGLGAPARAATALLVALQIGIGIDAAFLSSSSRLESALHWIRGEPGLSSTYRRDYREAGRSLPSGAVVLMHNWRPNLGIDRDVLFDMPGQQGLFSYDGVTDSRALVALWRGAGATHMLHRPGLRPAPTRQTEVLVAQLAAAAARSGSSKRFGTLEVIPLDLDLPPSEVPCRVLALGLEGYEDGLYPLLAMTTVETLDPSLRVYPSPEERLTRRADIGGPLFAKACAVLVGPGAPSGAPLQTALKTSFTRAVTYDGLAVWLRPPP